MSVPSVGQSVRVRPLVTTVNCVKNGRLDRDAVWGGALGGLEESCIKCACTLAPPGNTVERLCAAATAGSGGDKTVELT